MNKKLKISCLDLGSKNRRCEHRNLGIYTGEKGTVSVNDARKKG